MELWLSAITDLGFPAVVTLYLLHRIEGKLDMLNQSIQNLPNRFAEDSSAIKPNKRTGL